MLIDAIKKIPDENGIYQYVEYAEDTDYPTSDWEHLPDLSAVSGVSKNYWKYAGSNVIVEMTTSEKERVDRNVDIELISKQSNSTFEVSQSGRIYLYNDTRWISLGDDNYGVQYYQLSENAGTATVPLIEWEHQGILVDAGTRLSKLSIMGRCTTNSLVSELRFALWKKYPSNVFQWRTGIDNDGEFEKAQLYSDFFMQPQTIQGGSDEPFTGAINDYHWREINFDHLFEQKSILTLYAKPNRISTTTSNAYFPLTYKLEFISK